MALTNILDKFIPDSLPTFLDKDGNWMSQDNSLFSTPITIPKKESIIEKGKKAVVKIAEIAIPRVVEKVKKIQAGQPILEVVKEFFDPGDIAKGELESKKKAQEEYVAKGYNEKEAIARAEFDSVLGIVMGTIGGGKGKFIGKTSPIIPKIERGFIESVKRELPELKVAGQYIPRDTDELAIKAQNLIKENLSVAEKVAEGTDDAAIATTVQLLKHYVDAAEKATESVKNVLYDKAAELANRSAEKLTELGRSVQAASILSRLTPEGQARFAAREIARYNEKVGIGKKIPELTGEQTQFITDEMKTIQGMAEGIEKAMRFKELQDHISSLVPSPLIQKIIAVWKAGLLTGIKTSGLNIFANISHGVTEIVKDVPAAAADSISSLFTGERTLTLGVKGKGGLREGLEKGWRYLTTGFDERNIGVKLDYHKVNFGKGKIARGLQAYEESVFRVLGSEDQPFYYGAKARSIVNQAATKAKNAGLTDGEKQKFIDNLIENPTDDMVRYAVLDAEIAVFQNPTALGRIARGIQKLGGGIGEFIVPFGRTPSAVAMQIINYSPVGIIKTIWQNIGKGKFDQRLFSQEIGRGVTGTGFLWLGAELFKKGIVALDRPKTEKEQKLWELEGRKPNSIKIGDKWHSPTVLGPAGNLLLIGGHFQNAFNTSGSPTEAMSTALAGSAKSFTEQTFLTGINQVVQAINDPARSAEGYFGSLLSSTIPTISADVARATDPKERRAETILERIQTRVPGLRERLEPRIDVLGQEQKRIGNILEVIADPTRPFPEQKTPVIEELRRLWDAGFKASPTLLGDKKGFSALTQEQNTELWKRAGEITNEKLSALIANEEYKKLGDDEKAKKIENFIDKSKLIARVEKVLQLTEELRGEELKKRLSELKVGGLLTREVYLKYQQLR